MSLSTLLVASALVAAGAFGALAFTRWGRQRPLHRYAALSLAAHLLLLAAMATVRTGGPASPGTEDPPPVRVSLVARDLGPPEPSPDPAEPTQQSEVEIEAEAESDPSADLAEPSAITEPRDSQAAAPENQPEPPANPSAPSPPSKPDQPAPDTESGPKPPTEPPPEALAAEEAAPPSDSDPTVAQTPATPPESAAPQPHAPEPTPIPRAAPAAAPAPARAVDPVATAYVPSAYSQRGEQARKRLAADQGGTQETLDAVASAVDWLARAQRADGAWDAAAWGAGRETRTLGHDRRHAGARAETGLTGLALLAMGGAGHTHLAGPYRDTVTRGLQHLLNEQADDGSLFGDASLYARTYCHSMATFALAEAMAVTGDERLRPAVTAAAGFLERTQNHAGGGWRYGPGDRGDTSQMGWAVMALRSAEIAGVRVREETWSNCERFLNSVRRGRTGGLAAYQPQGRTSNTMTAEAMYCRQILGVACRSGCPEEAEAFGVLLNELPGARRPGSARATNNLYYFYYATLALHHARSGGPHADRAWHTWNSGMQRALLPRQLAEGPNAGSWAPDSVWAGYGGRVYSTALAAMCLEVYYRYDPEKIGRDPWIAARGSGLRR